MEKYFTLKRNATLHHLIPVSKSIVINLKDLLGVSFQKHVCIFRKNEQLSWNYNTGGMDLVAKFMLRHSDYNYNLSIYNRWKKYALKLDKIFVKIEKKDLNNLNTKNLAEIYKNLIQCFEIESAYGTLSDFLSSELIKNAVIKNLKKIGVKMQDLDVMLGVATISIFKSPYAKEQEELMQLAIKNNKGRNIAKELDQHTKKYWYIQNDYKNSYKLDKNYFAEQVNFFSKKNIEKEFRDLKKKQIYLVSKKKKLTREAKIKKLKDFYNLLRMIDIHVKLWDLKKVMMQKSFYYLDLLLNEISKKFNLTFDEIKWLTPDEVIKLFKNKKINKEIIRLRKKECVAIIKNGGIEVFTGKQAKNLIKNTEEKTPGNLKELKGQVGNIGKITGKVKIILSPRENKIIKRGEILVTGMTTPDFISLMKKSSAFITDEGGITCHAAIVARELNKPCIIGTKIATRVLKDGDFVEVDANRGIVKILKFNKSNK